MEIFNTVIDTFSGSLWPLGFFIYLVIGWIVVRPVGGAWSQLMSAIGWPMELAQRLSGASGIPYLLILPNFLIFAAFTFAPFFINFGLALTDGQSINFSGRPYVGDTNFVRLLGDVNPDTGQENLEDEKFLRAAGDTLIFVIFQVPIMIVFALCTALALNRKIRMRGFWRAVFFYPVMLSPVVVGILWALILKRQGVLSLALMHFGILDEPIQWLQDPRWTMFWSVLVVTWAHLGFYMLILLAGLQAIPADLYEAAEMDGAPPFRQLTRITLPLLAPTLLVVSVLALIKAFQVFEDLYALDVRWHSLVTYDFDTSGLYGQLTSHGLGLAAAASLLVALALIVMSLLQVRLSRRAHG